MKDSSDSYGYYHITVTSSGNHRLLRSNNERAFIITQLQDLLSPRLILGSVPAYRQLASCIDLLAYSIAHQSIHLLVFSIDATIASDFIHRIIARLSQYQYEYQPNHYSTNTEIRPTIELLSGPHEALRRSVELHLLHQDWEYDRYSSIGFYLHDRRGDWMRTWRLTKLYDNENSLYRELLIEPLDQQASQFTPKFLGSSLHA
jgi:hypothetical protein